jgi:hypothetical protein
MAAAKNSMTESRPNPTRAIEEASTPAVTATAASAVIQAMLAYSSQKPRRRSQARPDSSASLTGPARKRDTARRRCRSPHDDIEAAR